MTSLPAVPHSPLRSLGSLARSLAARSFPRLPARRPPPRWLARSPARPLARPGALWRGAASASRAARAPAPSPGPRGRGLGGRSGPDARGGPGGRRERMRLRRGVCAGPRVSGRGAPGPGTGHLRRRRRQDAPAPPARPPRLPAPSPAPAPRGCSPRSPCQALFPPLSPRRPPASAAGGRDWDFLRSQGWGRGPAGCSRPSPAEGALAVSPGLGEGPPPGWEGGY